MKILTKNKNNLFYTNQEKQQHIKKLEHEIDQLVYKLCGLTEKEIKIIEGRYNG